MNVSLASILERSVSQKVQSGMYHSPREVIREGLGMPRERNATHQQKLEELRREIQIGIDQADQGKLGPLDSKATLSRVREKRSQKGKK